MFKLNQCVWLVGLGFKKGRRFSKKSFISPFSSRVLKFWPVYPRADLATLNRISVILSRETFSPGPSLFSSSLTCFLNEDIYTQLLRNRLDQRIFLLFRWVLLLHFVCGYAYWQVHRHKVDLGDSCDWEVRHLCRFDRQIYVPKWRKRYGTILDKFDRGLTVVRQLELISEFKNEVLFCFWISIKVLFAETGDIAICLCDLIDKLILLRNEWKSFRIMTYWVVTGLIGLGMFKIFGSQLFFQPDLVQKRLLSRILKAISIK